MPGLFAVRATIGALIGLPDVVLHLSLSKGHSSKDDSMLLFVYGFQSRSLFKGVSVRHASA